MIFHVQSTRDPSKVYHVGWSVDHFTCSCPHWQFRCRHSKKRCKHILRAIDLGYRRGGGFDPEVMLQLIGEVEE